MTELEQLAKAVEHLAITVQALETTVETLRTKVDADSDLTKKLVRKLDRNQRNDRLQQQELSRVKQIMLSVILLIGGGFIAGEKFNRLGDENVAKLLEIGTYLLGGSVAITAASQQAKPNVLDTDDEEE